MTQVFKAGDKVEIVQGGWGFHPKFVGKIMTIHERDHNGRYTTVEALSDPSLMSRHKAKDTSVNGNSFKLVVPVEPADKIRQINVELRALAEQNATIDRQMDALRRDKYTQVQALLKELDE